MDNASIHRKNESLVQKVLMTKILQPRRLISSKIRYNVFTVENFFSFLVISFICCMSVQSVSSHVYKVTIHNIYNTQNTSGGKNREIWERWINQQKVCTQPSDQIQHLATRIKLVAEETEVCNKTNNPNLLIYKTKIRKLVTKN